jgi:hypothetical protein
MAIDRSVRLSTLTETVDYGTDTYGAEKEVDRLTEQRFNAERGRAVRAYAL